jgi:CDP-diacylglycerol--serine O-phosphatidyltransferase
MALFSPRFSLSQLPRIAQDAASVRTLHNASEFRTSLLAAIGAAKQRIVLCSLYLQHDEAGAEVLAALYAARAARPDLQIAVLVDWHRAQRGLIGAAQSGGNAEWYQAQSRLHGGGVPIYGVPIQTRELFGVLHLKGFVIDDTVLYSGASLNNVYLHKFDKFRHDRYMLLDNRTLADSMVQFVERHILAARMAVHRLDLPDVPSAKSINPEITQFRAKLKKARYPVPHTTLAEGSLSVTPLVGVGRNNPLNRVICQLLASSREHITICTPYFNFPLAIKREINRALRRGVTIDIIVGDKLANDFYIPPEEPFKIIGALPYLYEINLRRFAQKYQGHIASRQLKVFLWHDGEHSYHAKGLWIDHRYSLLTGNNLNPRAFRLDLENALLIDDPQQQLAEQNRAELDGILRSCAELTHFRAMEEMADYPPEVRKLLTRLSRTRLDRLLYRVL